MKRMSGSEIIEKIVEYMQSKDESERDRARRIYHLVENQLREWVLNDEIPVWLVWEHYYEGELSLNQLRAICTDHGLALKCESIIKDKAKAKKKKVHISIEGTRLNHLFAWIMIQKSRKET